jgi:hypothetical protein
MRLEVLGGRVGEWESGRVGEWESGRVKSGVFRKWRFFSRGCRIGKLYNTLPAIENGGRIPPLRLLGVA